MDLRNTHRIACTGLRDTESLEKNLPLLTDVYVQPKFDGHHVTIQISRGEAYVVSRGKEGGRKGVAVSKDADFRQLEVPKWLQVLAANWNYGDVLLEAERCAAFGGSSNHAARKDTEKVFHVFDCLWYDGHDLRGRPYIERLWHIDMSLSLLDRVLGDTINQIQRAESEPLPCFTRETMSGLEDKIRTEGIEGYVIKPADWTYGATCGWKLKLTDNEDGVVTGWTPGKKHHLGKVTPSGLVGSFTVSQSGRPVGEVPAGRLNIPWGEAESYVGQVLEFKHKGWDKDNEKFRFPRFVQWRDDKPASDCIKK